MRTFNAELCAYIRTLTDTDDIADVCEALAEAVTLRASEKEAMQGKTDAVKQTRDIAEWLYGVREVLP